MTISENDTRRDVASFAAGSALGLGAVIAAGALFGLMIGLALVRWGPLERFDIALVQAWTAAAAEPAWVQSVLRTVTELGGSAVTWSLFAATTLYLAIRRLPRLAVYVAVTGLGAQTLSLGVKALVDRARPAVEAVLQEPSGASFPSGHTLGATVTYGMLLLVFLPVVQRRHHGRAVAAAVTVIGVVGLTRIALGVHFPTDVLGGWLLGVAWLGVTALAFRRWTAAGAGLVPGRVARDSSLAPTPVDEAVLPDGVRTVAVLVIGFVLVWGALLGLGWVVTESPAIRRLDTEVVTWFVAVRTEWLSTAMVLVGRLGGTLGVAIGLAFATTVAVARLRLRRPAVFLIVAVAGETMLFLATATLVERARPAVEQLSPGLPPTSSFPSGHAAAATALYVATGVAVAAWTDRRWLRHLAWGWAVALPLLVALSRLYRGVHHPTDVVVSLLYASVWVAVCWTVLQPGPDAEQDGAGHDDAGHDRAGLTAPG